MFTMIQQAQRVTIKDVADVAGVSVATVSKVINGRYGVAAATSERVMEIISELGYESSLVARSLRSHRTNVIGILVAEFEPFSTQILQGVSNAIAATGFELLAYSAGGDGSPAVGWEKRYLSRLSGTLIDGAILVTPTVLEVGQGTPVVAIDPHTGPGGIPTVDSDNLGGSITATEHLINLGHRRIGFLSGRPDLESSRLRESGFRHAMKKAGLEVDEDLIRVGSYRRESAEQPVHELLALPNRPTAIFAANDISAIATIEVAQSLGLNVPGDLSVIGFDNVPESALSTPPLTTVAQPIQQMGTEALEMLIRIMNGTEGEVDHVEMPTQLIERASTAQLTSAGN